MPNPCEGCPSNCCLNFKITTELTRPDTLRATLEKYPYRKPNGTDVVLFNNKERIVHTYSCDRFDIQTQTCNSYGKEPRPSFCENTGEKGFFPHNQCLLIHKKV